MKVCLRVTIKPGTSFQDAMEVFDKLERCTILDIDHKRIENTLKSNVKSVWLYFPCNVFDKMSVRECSDTVIRFAGTFDDILSQYSCVNHRESVIMLIPQKGDKKVVNLSRTVTSRAFNEVKDMHGKLLLRKPELKRVI